MRTLDTLEPGSRFTTRSFKRTGKVLSQCDGSVYVKWDSYVVPGLFGNKVRPYEEHVSRKTEVE